MTVGRSSQPVSIRPAVVTDAATIHAGLLMIAKAVGAEEKIVSTIADIERGGFGDRPAFVALIAESGSDFAGMSVFFRSFSTWRGQSGAYIQDFVVAEAFRGTGLAERLVRATARHVRDLWDARFLRLSVDADNARARRFYEQMGLAWSRSEAIHAAYGPDFDLLANANVTIQGQD